MLLLRGVLIGLAIAAPVGPIGVLCIRRSVAFGRVAGFVSGMGAATADACYGAVAAFGLTAISDVLVRQAAWFRVIGGAFLILLGLRTALARARGDASAVPRRTHAAAYASTFALTLANPTTILSFAAVYASLGIARAPSRYGSAAVLVAGVFAGSAVWWLFLSAVASRLRGRLGQEGLGWINRISGAVIAGFGVAAILAA